LTSKKIKNHTRYLIFYSSKQKIKKKSKFEFFDVKKNQKLGKVCNSGS